MIHEQVQEMSGFPCSSMFKATDGSMPLTIEGLGVKEGQEHLGILRWCQGRRRTRRYMCVQVQNVETNRTRPVNMDKLPVWIQGEGASVHL